ncbi:MAG: beta-eliminating lyase-related protein [Peptoniphilaceae bacterium]|nr:beta-eliminating lyase-related protein [Peptoniphilaceae bacterium]MDY6019515.1 beta-eliminating lyase-related protein [Anaerococcus sp.]
MLSFSSDYIAGAHPDVLKALVDTNLESMAGYGNDIYTQKAIEKIKKEIDKPDAQVYLLTGGTQTNQIVIDTMLDDYQGVISATSGHVNVHEAGAIEFSGHKVLTVDTVDGKINAKTIRSYLELFYKDGSYEHMVFPGMVYISYPTEYGSLYSKKELEDIYSLCKEYQMQLFIDGARLAYGLMSDECDLTMKDLARLCDVFYIGGTKCGALAGEAVVFTHNNQPKRFNTLVKQRGAMIAKGRLLGVEFDALFTNGLYYEIGKIGIDKAKKLKEILASKGYEFFMKTSTNQQFILIENKKMEELAKKVDFGFTQTYDENHTVIRFASSWSTTDEDLKLLEECL